MTKYRETSSSDMEHNLTLFACSLNWIDKVIVKSNMLLMTCCYIKLKTRYIYPQKKKQQIYKLVQQFMTKMKLNDNISN